ncbi:hypothetical protein LP420_35615 [Massilia sp. B-10]|nr:hypothetical protein LP420_35615 [Massilia sp. B-10]
MNEHISKPIHQEELVMVLAQWMPRASAAAVPDASGDQFAPLRAAGVDVGWGLNRLHGNDIAYRKLLLQIGQLQAWLSPTSCATRWPPTRPTAPSAWPTICTDWRPISARPTWPPPPRLEQAVAAYQTDVEAQLAALLPRLALVCGAMSA